MFQVYEAICGHEILGYYVFRDSEIATRRLFSTEGQAKSWIKDIIEFEDIAKRVG